MLIISEGNFDNNIVWRDNIEWRNNIAEITDVV